MGATASWFPEPETTVPEPTWSSTTAVPTSTGDVPTGGDGSSTSSGYPDSTGSPPDFGTVGPKCNGKIDFLFVLDRHEGAQLYWERLAEGLAAFRSDLLAAFDSFDMHFMTVDGFAAWGLPGCHDLCADTNMCAQGPGDFPCDGYDQLTACDQVRGAGLTYPAGFAASNHRCELAGGKRYIQTSLEPDVATALECITTTGYSNIGGAHAEWSMVAALEPAINHQGGCNEGFLRDDALLVIVFFWRNFDDWAYLGDPHNWAEKVIAAKGGDPGKVAVIGLITDRTAEAPTVCPGPSDGSYSSYAEKFLYFFIEHYIHGSLCAADYRPYFDAGLALVMDLCGVEAPT